VKKNTSKETNHENFNLPTGGGKNGFEFGSVLAAPAGITIALSFGQI
jgi:hypothetical protein